MKKVISLEERWRELASQKADASKSLEHEKFLIDEGLELLAAFRSITDRKTRVNLLALVKKVAGRK